MLFAVVFTDKPGQGALRQAHLQAHIDWIDAHKHAVLVAGSLRKEPGDVPRGGLWLVEAESKDAVQALMQSDPFFTCGLRQQIEVLHYSKALPDHRALV
ncbi:MAG: YciI family protein [Pseudomonadota bacterium]|nr:YciI family protein [Pseudomonadota bacterium]